MTKLLTLLVLLCLARPVWAADPPKPKELKGSERLQGENLRLKAENLELRMQPLAEQLQRLQQEAAAFAKAQCGDRELDWAALACVVKPGAPEPAPDAPPHPNPPQAPVEAP
jgi:hypothetical protein